MKFLRIFLCEEFPQNLVLADVASSVVLISVFFSGAKVVAKKEHPIQKLSIERNNIAVLKFFDFHAFLVFLEKISPNIN